VTVEIRVFHIATVIISGPRDCEPKLGGLAMNSVNINGIKVPGLKEYLIPSEIELPLF
jgi:hypothetical protein